MAFVKLLEMAEAKQEGDAVSGNSIRSIASEERYIP